MNIRDVRREFPVTRNWVFLNHAGTSPMSSRAAARGRAFLAEVEENGGAFPKGWTQALRSTRALAAGLLHCQPEEIAFLENTATGVSLVAAGLELKTGDNVIIADVEYPANVYPWLDLQRDGVEVRFVREREGRVPAEDFIKLMDDRTRAVSVSFVEFASGYRADVQAIGRACRERGIFFFVDGAQGVGALDLDVKGCFVDALCTTCAKWLLGPQGLSVFYCCLEALEKIRPRTLGARSVVREEDFLNYDLVLKPNAERFECGTLNMVGIHCLKGALDLASEVGIGAAESRVVGLTDFLCEGLRDRGYRIYSPRGEGEKSGIISFFSESVTPEELFRRGRERRIFFSVRAGRARVSPHFYNTEEEIEKFLDLLP